MGSCLSNRNSQVYCQKIYVRTFTWNVSFPRVYIYIYIFFFSVHNPLVVTFSDIDHLNLFPYWRKNTFKQKNFHKLFDLLNIRTLKLSYRYVIYHISASGLSSLQFLSNITIYLLFLLLVPEQDWTKPDVKDATFGISIVTQTSCLIHYHGSRGWWFWYQTLLTLIKRSSSEINFIYIILQIAFSR